MLDIVFVLTVFGERYAKFLLPNIYTIKKHHKNSSIKIYHSGVPKNILKQCEKVSDLIHVDVDSSDDKHNLINSRMKYWHEGSNENKKVVLIDVDMLFLKNIESFFKNNSIIYTTRSNHVFPINLGILLLDNGKDFQIFTNHLAEETLRIYSDIKQRLYAKQFFGSCDQQAFLNIKKDYKTIEVPCRLLNEVDCNFDNLTHIVHYKTGWHPILLDGMNFSDSSRKNCIKAYRYWLEINSKVNIKIF